MEFLIEYGLFLSKTVTFVVAIGVIVAIIVSSSGSHGRKSDDDHIEIEKLNDRYDEYKDLMQSVVLSADELKKLHKEEKKRLKADKKNKGDNSSSVKKRVFVAEFDGDVKASDAENLRKLITAILSEATTNDEVVINLESPGGMVHSYGLAASQLARISAKNIPLTVCVDKVAASGGYMMACVADKIVAAPFAVIGSIGVVAQLPNFHKLLKKADVDYEIYTAGEYKRTLTMFGENTDKGREKFVEELEDTHVLFKDYVSEHRPIVDIEDVATGEIWFGSRALDKKLVDEICTSDEYLQNLSESADIFKLEIAIKQTLVEKLGLSITAGIERSANKLMQMASTRYFS